MLAFDFEETNVLRQALKDSAKMLKLDGALKHTIASNPSVLVVFQDGSYFHRGKEHVDGLLVQPSSQAPPNEAHPNFAAIVSLVDSSFFRQQTRTSRLIRETTNELTKIASERDDYFLNEFDRIIGKLELPPGSQDQLTLCDILVHRFSKSTIAKCNRGRVRECFVQGVRHEESLIAKVNGHRIKVPASTIDESMLHQFLQTLANESLRPNWTRYDKDSTRFVVSPEIEGVRIVLKSMDKFSLGAIREELLERRAAVWFNSPRRQMLSELIVDSQQDLDLVDRVQSRLKELKIEDSLNMIVVEKDLH